MDAILDAGSNSNFQGLGMIIREQDTVNTFNFTEMSKIYCYGSALYLISTATMFGLLK